MADVNDLGAKTEAGALSQESGEGRAIGLHVDVADAASVDELIHQVVRAYGGLDLLVSNAGVLRAASVKTQAERDFDLSTAVNYKGYFLCVQKAVPVMAIPRRVLPGYWSDIIQINSKSGLVGSEKNFAYAGSKFGGVGLTESFALELVSDGIKVNSICPGNLLDGPLWSDPETGLFVQYLNAGQGSGRPDAGRRQEVLHRQGADATWVHDGRRHEGCLLPRGTGVRDRAGAPGDRWSGDAALAPIVGRSPRSSTIISGHGGVL